MAKEKEEKMHFPKVTLDNYFMTQEERDAQTLEKVQILPLNKMSSFPNHPYKINEDDELEDMANTIKENGVIHPIIVRPKKDGGYEIISGHRRKRASEKAGFTTIPAIVRNMSDDEAIIYMVDSNKQRERVLPSERAFAYKMKLDAIKRQGKRNDLTLSQVATKLDSAKIIGGENGESRDTVFRYIRLTYLIPEL